MAEVITREPIIIGPKDPNEPWCPACLSGVGPTDPSDPIVKIAEPAAAVE